MLLVLDFEIANAVESWTSVWFIHEEKITLFDMQLNLLIDYWKLSKLSCYFDL